MPNWDVHMQHAVKFMKGEWEREETFKPLLERILGQKITNLALEAREGIFRTRLTMLSQSGVTVTLLYDTRIEFAGVSCLPLLCITCRASSPVISPLKTKGAC